MFEFSFINEAHWEGEWDGHQPWLEPHLFWDAVADVLAGESLERGPYEENLTWRTPFFDVHFEVTEKGDDVIHGLDVVVIPKNSNASTLDFRRVTGRLLALAEAVGLKLYSHERDAFLTAEDIANWQPDIAGNAGGRAKQAQQDAAPPPSFSSGRMLYYSRVLYYLIGAAALVVLIFRWMGEGSDRQTVPASRRSAASQEISAPQPVAELWLDKEFTVHRGELTPAGHARSLTWVIQENGNTVLERNAENEFSYRYYALKPGNEYVIFLKAYYAGAYHPVSESVTFTFR